MSKVIITGGNRGIGKQIGQELSSLGHQVILTARSKEKGKEAAEEMKADFMQLDVSDGESISAFATKYLEKYGSLDVLINNAGIFQDKDKSAHDPDFNLIRETLDTNLLGAWQLIIELLPALKKSNDPRVINMSSGLGAMDEMGANYPGYRLSKVGMNAMTRMLHSELEHEIKINSMCPGWVKTDMGGKEAHRSLKQGAETAIWLATERNIPNGKFLRDRKVIDW
ncbi:MAG: SDR family NAD(P)-dependent oxidoreductase [Bacteroidota bacterium]